MGDITEFLSFESFLTWLISAGGMGLVYNYTVQAVKKWLKWEDQYAVLLSAGVSLLLGTLAFFALKFKWYVYVEEFWPVLVIWFALTVGGWLISQLNYKAVKRLNGS